MNAPAPPTTITITPAPSTTWTTWEIVSSYVMSSSWFAQLPRRPTSVAQRMASLRDETPNLR